MRLVFCLLLCLSSPVLSNNKPSDDAVILAFVGDTMLGSNYKDIPPQNPENILKTPASVLQSADIAFGNLEGAITLAEKSSKEGCEKCYAFRQSPSVAKVLSRLGFDVMSVANNHARDFGDKGFVDTVAHLREAGILASGVPGDNFVSVAKKGTRFSFLSFSPNSGLPDPRNRKNIERAVSAAKQKSDFVIVSFHMGAEGQNKTRIPLGPEHHLGENRGNVRQAAETAIDSGADLVIAHGPHVPRPLVQYKGKWIAYSLGNFATFGSFALSGNLGASSVLLLTVRKNQVEKIDIISLRQKKNEGRYRVDLDPARAAEKIMRQKD